MTAPILRVLPKLKRRERTRYELVDPFRLPNGELVPAGFVTDLASTPKPMDDYFGMDPGGKLTEPALGHDFRYSLAERPRKDCDLEFLGDMRVSEVHPFVAIVYYRTVRMFGWRRYGRK